MNLTLFRSPANLQPNSMRRILFSRFWLTIAGSLGLFTAVSCGTNLGLPPAGAPNFSDTLTLFALRGTPITTPSAFDVVLGQVARTQQGELFDFAFDFDSSGAPAIFPSGTLGLPPEAGIRVSNLAFDSILKAPTDGYVVDKPASLSLGLVFIARSRNSNLGACRFLGALPRYGKFRVLELDFAERSVTMESLVDINCGFRGLEPGFPTS